MSNNIRIIESARNHAKRAAINSILNTFTAVERQDEALRPFVVAGCITVQDIHNARVNKMLHPDGGGRRTRHHKSKRGHKKHRTTRRR